MKYTGANRAARDAAATVLDKAYGYPLRGTNVGGGVHVPMPATWDGTGPVPPGWSSFQGHRNDADGAVFLPEEPETGSKLARLSPAEQAQLAAIRAASVPDAPAEVAAKEAR